MQLLITFSVTVAAVFVLIFLNLLLKRLLLIGKIKAVCKKSAIKVDVIHPLRSIFLRDDQPDLLVTTGDAIYRVFILTTMFRRARYHFEDSDELTVYRKHLLNMKAGSKIHYTVSFKIYETKGRKYKNFRPVKSEVNYRDILLIHPVPLEISALKNNGIVRILDGDIMGNFEVYSGKGFRDKLRRINEC